ncbi:hypothetical protein THOG11_260037 [Vibrio harveyi]|uniref:hypothetical protein n=1 Tax=Vibrio sp. B1ASS3 TaxID=2751176 RepID=UPI001ABB8301|nr:hypothetical protein [Vibrio sp. B1ASS3]CAH1218856.1 hypothetical protein TH15OA1_360014 [Vibrio harveyi]CAD7798711.1 hypothetical protein ACOMICROBIO_NCLOACGD_00415 [Vibrio sp. B1ASS3]CAE6883295.1 hypothetical protein ACOMICROBIO_NCLOACGD_00415 [Vibrio sp. B1ASS3]CAH1561847.1 hypothetical protein THOD03_280037 [Vibrio harveyi]CAH1568325.1 hypothetical protein THOG11_260037 [Vibrio harveyi]
MENYSPSFKCKLLKSIDNKKSKRLIVQARVLKHCVDAGLIEQEDINSDSTIWKWLSTIINDNLTCLSLLEEVTCLSIYTTEDFEMHIDELVSTVVKDIAKRVLQAHKCECSDKDKN